MKSTQAMRDRIRELMGREQDDYDRAVECVLDDLEGLLSAPAQQTRDGLREQIEGAVKTTLEKSAPGISETMRHAIVHSIMLKLGGALPPPKTVARDALPRWPAKGDTMTFLGKNGYPQDLAAALKIFTPGQAYRVHDCNVQSWSHSIQFDGVKGWHNGVMFDLCTLPSTDGGGK